ncbi:hypothetical protein ABW19_dt0207565 [Dactylella cylindrospora]|nr:hypothetical protein ABW19_dt0207565 [Dactylella cylindrospora]
MLANTAGKLASKALLISGGRIPGPVKRKKSKSRPLDSGLAGASITPAWYPGFPLSKLYAVLNGVIPISTLTLLSLAAFMVTLNLLWTGIHPFASIEYLDEAEKPLRVTLSGGFLDMRLRSPVAMVKEVGQSLK